VCARSGTAVFLVAALAATTPALAQRVRGTLKDSATSEPIPGAVVTTSDSAGTFLSRAVSDEHGRFDAYKVRRASKIRIVRIGYRPREVMLPTDGTDSLDVRLAAIPSLLSAVTASSKRVCPGETGGGGALELWEQARSGLLAAVVSRETRPPRVRLHTFSRTFEPVRKRLLDDSVVVKDVRVERSYVAARPAWAFAAEGYMRENFDGSRDYFAPDDAVLLDPSFAETHCLHVVAADGSHPAQIGIGFDPVPDASRDTLVDLIGVLWIDEKKPSLRSFEFHYTNLESYAKGSGGEIQFALMPNGAPMIDRWKIHFALIATDEEPGGNGLRRRPPPRPMRTNVRLLGWQDVGGEIAFIDWDDGTHWGANLPKFSGVVVNPAGGRVAGARVWVRGGSDTAITAADGTFRLPYAGAAKVVLLASDSVLAAAGISLTVPTPFQMPALGNWDVWLTMHPRSVVLPNLCPANAYKPGTGVLFATVNNANGTPAAGVQVEVETRQAIVVGDTIMRPRKSSGVAGDDGRFVVCGAALNQPLLLRAIKGEESAEAMVEQWKDEIMAATLVLKPRPPSVPPS
jgi:hypothetical protein